MNSKEQKVTDSETAEEETKGGEREGGGPQIGQVDEDNEKVEDKKQSMKVSHEWEQLNKDTPRVLRNVENVNHEVSALLCVRRVLITDHCVKLMPEWQRLVNGVVDSEDLPLNTFHETLEHDKVLGLIKKGFVKKCLRELP